MFKSRLSEILTRERRSTANANMESIKPAPSKTHQDVKKHVSIAGMFKGGPDHKITKARAVGPLKKQARKHANDDDHRSNLASKKSTHKSHKQASHALALAFDETTASYKADISATLDNALDPIHHDLLNRLNNLPSTYDSLLPPSTTLNDLSTLKTTTQDLTAPLASTILSIRRKAPNGGGTIREQIALGVTVTNFERKVGEKTRELEGLWREWEGVQREIDELGGEMMGDEMFAAMAGSAAEEACEAANDLEELATALRTGVERICEVSKKEVHAEDEEDAEKTRVRAAKWRDLLRDNA